MEYSVTTLRKLLYNMYMNSNEYMKEIPDLQVDEDEFKAMVFIIGQQLYILIQK